MLIKPKRLKLGDTIGIVAPSSPLPEGLDPRLNQGVLALREMGFGVKVGKHVRARVRHTAGTLAQRLEDLHAMFLDPEVKAVFHLRGGSHAPQLLEHLDYQLMESHPKIFMGSDDITVLLAALHQRSHLVTFHGPVLLESFGETGGLPPYTREWMRRILMDGEAPVALTPSERWRESARVREGGASAGPWRRHSGPAVVRPGEAEGALVGGRLGALLMLAGTPYWPEMDGKVLFVAEGEGETPETYDRSFTRLRHMGVFRRIAGLLVGRPHAADAFTPHDPLEAILLEATHGGSMPIVMGCDFGHTDPTVILPIGARVAINTFEPPYLTLLESGVS